MLQPVREAAVAAFTVRPGADAQHDLKALCGAGEHKGADIQIAGEVEFSFGFFMVDPQDICSDDADAAGFHLRQFARPVFPAVAGKVVFAHHRDNRPAAAGDIPAVYFDGFAIRVRAAHAHVPAEDGGGGMGHETDRHDRLLLSIFYQSSSIPSMNCMALSPAQGSSSWPKSG